MTDRPVAVDSEVGGEEVLRCVGRQVKALRKRARLERPELGERIGYSPSLVAAVEQGRRVPQPEFLTAADTVLDACGALAAAVELVAHVRVGRPARGEPAALAAWHGYAALTVPGPLRTAEYARAVLRTVRPPLDEDTVERRLAAHRDRPPVPLIGCVIEEAVLHRPCGGRAVLRAQLAHLLELGRSRRAEVQVMPTAVEDHAGTDGSFALLEPAGGGTPVARVGGRATTRRDTVRALEHRYGALRAQALSPAASLALIGELAAEG